MILDTSALVAVVFQEPGFESILGVLSAADTAAIGAPTAAETGILLGSRLGFKRTALLPRLLEEFRVEVIPFDKTHLAEAIFAYERFGRGSHRARLNFGDCLTYATARIAEQPILCVGGDFALTDAAIVSV